MSDKQEKLQLTNQDRFTALFEQSPLSIQIFSPDGKTLRVNHAWEELWGIKLEQIEDYNILEDPQLVEKGIMSFIERAFAGESVQTPPILYDPDETIPDITRYEEPQRWTQAILYPLKDTNGNVLEVILIHEDITARKKIEQKSERLTQQLESQKRHLQELVSSVPGVVWEAWGEPDEASQRIDFVNEYVTEMLGYTVEEWLSTPNFWLKIVHEEDKEKAAAAAAATFSSRSKGVNRFRWIAKDGSTVWVESQSTVICNEAGEPVGMRGVTMDITERRQKEVAERFLFEAGSALASSLDYETTLKTVAELAVPHFADWCAVDILGSDGKLARLAVTHINPEKIAWAKELYAKYPPHPDSPVGAYNALRTGESEFYSEITDDILIQTSQSEEHLDLLREVGFRSAMLVPLKTRDRVLGVISFVSSDSRSLTAEDLTLAEDLAGRAALAVDNARLFRAEQVMRRAAQRNSDFLNRLQAVSSSLSQALTPKEVAEAVIEQGINSLGSHAGIVVLTNEESDKLNVVGTIGFPVELMEKWQQFNINQKVPLADSIRTQKPVFIGSFESFKSEYPFLDSLTEITKSKALVSLPLVVKGKTIGGMGLSFPDTQEFGSDDRIFLIALAQQCAQALERANLYEIERNLRTEAENANRIKDEFLATVSHELRTPLNAIVGWSGLLKSNRLNDEEKERAVETIERNAKSQAQIIEDLLDVSRIITGKLKLQLKAVKLEKIVKATIETLRPSAETKEITIETVLDKSVLVKADAERLQQVLWNLLSNAIKFTPKGGNIEVALKSAGSFAKVSVKDNGQGINPKFVPFVFERFRQADATTTRNHGGLGLGLSIVHHLVEMHGGSVDVESEGEGKGATFSIKIPTIPAENTIVQDTKEESNGKNSLDGLRILLVDDEKDSLELLKTIIEIYGAETKTAASASEALEVLENYNPHILISDIAMPYEDGYSLIRKVRLMPNEKSSIPAIALTAYAREGDKKRAMDAGFQVHLAKPIDDAELIELIISFFN